MPRGGAHAFRKNRGSRSGVRWRSVRAYAARIKDTCVAVTAALVTAAQVRGAAAQIVQLL